MRQRRIRHLLVVDDHRLVGVITDRDIRLNGPSPATSLSVREVNHLLERLTVDRVMTSDVITITPAEDLTSAARLMLEHTIGCLPVVAAGQLVGIVTDTDLVRVIAQLGRLAPLTL
jgi:CBS domain-containing protein